ncbi:hypothetical protein KI659_14615 [Litoribacter alkaliphilus]|uniref:Uncharacterized protein n=1 Tax=Litoribacter ruber TaxID=702568 RepID=A0AAP2G633_9BACT|nr:hypothetical protein [Litoribacter alkaliphilus]MBS9525248.1 hypothetical protein [Litoribacter alkaliphilus]
MADRLMNANEHLAKAVAYYVMETNLNQIHGRTEEVTHSGCTYFESNIYKWLDEVLLDLIEKTDYEEFKELKKNIKVRLPEMVRNDEEITLQHEVYFSKKRIRTTLKIFLVPNMLHRFMNDKFNNQKPYKAEKVKSLFP